MLCHMEKRIIDSNTARHNGFYVSIYQSLVVTKGIQRQRTIMAVDIVNDLLGLLIGHHHK